jgi:hypothetical protein
MPIPVLAGSKFYDEEICLTLHSAISLSNTATPFDKRIEWDARVRPSMSLSRALQIAQEELKSTNLAAKADKFYCLSAKVVGASTKDGAWSFQFASKRVKYGLQKLRSMAMYSFIRLETMLKIGACRPNKSFARRYVK